MTIPRLRKRLWWKSVLKICSKHSPEVQQQNRRKSLVPSVLNELFLTFLVTGLNTMIKSWKSKSTCIWRFFFPENGLVLFGLTANVAIQHIITTKWREVCCDSVAHNSVCTTHHPSHKIYVCPSIFGIPCKCSYLLCISFFSGSFLQIWQCS